MGGDSAGYAPGALISGSKFTMAMSPRISVSCSINCNTVSLRAGVETPQATHARMWSGIGACPEFYGLARRLAGRDVTANCLHPGAVATRLGQNNGRLATAITKLLRPFFRTPEQGAATAIYLASSPAVEGVSGKYFVDCREARSSGATYDTELTRRLWDASARLTALEPGAAGG